MDDRVDAVNRQAWGRVDVVATFAQREGPIDDGEAVVLAALAQHIPRGPVLDIGVGAGRTIPLLQPLADEYVAVDYVAEQVHAARARFPGVRIEVADARALPFPDASFELVFFSFNGIDGVAHEDRPVVLAEVHRVLRPGGYFAYSTHNLAERAVGESLWRTALARTRAHPLRLARYAIRAPAAFLAVRRLRGLTAHGDGWRTAVDPSYGFSVVWHHVSYPEALRELERAGFVETRAYDATGRALGPDDEPTTPWFHLVTRTAG